MSVCFSSYQAFASALASAQAVDLSAYTLGHGTTERALLAAAAHGAQVRVRLAGTVYGDPSGMLARHNSEEVAELSEHGIDAAILAGGDLHLKAALIDGYAYFDDRNWCGDSDLIVASDAASDLAATREALDGAEVAPSADGLVFTKGDALKEEADVLLHAQGAIALQTETLGPSLITKSLYLAAARVPVRVLVKRSAALANVRIKAVLAKCGAVGVEVRTTGGNDKFCLDATDGWVGSANASGSDPHMSDWGAPVKDLASLAQLQARFEKEWTRAKPV
jgi:hypothetical protein